MAFIQLQPFPSLDTAPCPPTGDFFGVTNIFQSRRFGPSPRVLKVTLIGGSFIPNRDCHVSHPHGRIAQIVVWFIWIHIIRQRAGAGVQ